MATVGDDDVGGDGRDDNESVSRGGTPAPLSDGSGATPGGGAAGSEASETSERAGASGARDETTVDGGDDGWRRGQAAAAAEQAARAVGGCPPPACGEGPVGMSGCGGPAVTPVCYHRCFLRLDDAFTLPVTTWAFDDGQLLGQEFSIIAPT